MKLTPRSEEVAVVVDLLEADGFATADSLAKAIIHAAWDALCMRSEIYAAAIFDEAGARISPVYGPYSSESDAVTSLKKLGLGGFVRVARINGSGVIAANVSGKPGWPGYCQTPDCGHMPALHAQEGSSRGECRSSRCTCTKFKR